MSLDPDRIRTVTVDSYGTIVASTPRRGPRAARRRPRSGRRRLARPLAHLRPRRRTTWTRTNPFWDVLPAALDYALSATGVELRPDAREEVLGVYRRLGQPPESWGPTPDLVVPSFGEIAELLA